MNEEIFKNTINGEEGAKKEGAGEAPENAYEQYKSLGGIINEQDYESALERSRQKIVLDRTSEIQINEVSAIAIFSGIALHNTKDVLDPRVALYIILRSDFKSKEVAEYHHADMGDKRIFANALRMLGDVDSLNKLIGACHKIGTHCPICLKVVASGEGCY